MPHEKDVPDFGGLPRTFLALASIALLALAQCACGGNAANQTTSPSGDSTVNTAVEQVPPNSATGAYQLTLDPTAVNFSSILVGSAVTQTVVLKNSGSSSLTIASASLSGPGFSVTGLTLPLTLGAGATANFSVTFAPSSPGTAGGSVDFQKNGGAALATLPLSGTGAIPLPHQATIAWTASTSSVDSYNVYRGTQSGGPYAKITSVAGTVLTATDSTVVSGQTYYYVVSAVSGSQESLFSKEVVAVIPSP